MVKPIYHSSIVTTKRLIERISRFEREVKDDIQLLNVERKASRFPHIPVTEPLTQLIYSAKKWKTAFGYATQRSNLRPTRTSSLRNILQEHVNGSLGTIRSRIG